MINIKFNIIGDDSEGARQIEREIAAPFRHHAMIPHHGAYVNLKGESNNTYTVHSIRHVCIGADMEIHIGLRK